MRRVAELLLAAKNPIIHAGQGILYSGATKELVKLAELLQAPVLTTNTGKGAFPENHPLSLGACVVSAPVMAFHWIKKADVILGMGTSFTRNHWAPQIPNGKRIIHCTNDPGDIAKEFPTEAAILGDSRLVLQALIDEKADIAILDARRYDEYHTMSIPTGTSVPGAELVLRAGTIAPDPDTTIIVNCAGRTRSLIGAQSLINAGVMIANIIWYAQNTIIGIDSFGEGVSSVMPCRTGWHVASRRFCAAALLLTSSNSSRSTIKIPPGTRSLRFVASAAGFIATSAST